MASRKHTRARRRSADSAVLAKATVTALALAAIATPRPSFAVLAFPGATGFGANATGGRGGDVYHVTTVADDPAHVIRGSLFYGLYTKSVPAGGRTIVFDVGGTINLGSMSLDIKNIKNVTIAGQTAPSPITIINNTTQVTSSTGLETGNIIVQYLTFRKGNGANGDDAFHIQGQGNTHDIMIDHVSGSWSEDEVISATQNATNVTVQNSIMSEALTSDHAFGSLVRPQINSSISFNHNLYSNQKSRNPRPGTYNGMTLDFEFQNNVIYNWSDRAGYIAGADTDTQHLNMNYVGNYLIAGPMAIDNSGNPTRRETAFLKENNTAGPLDIHIFQSGNKIDSNSNTIRDGTDTGWGMFQQVNGTTFSALPDADKVASRFNYPESAADSADVAYGKAISSVGAFPYARSDVDRRLINDVINYTGVAPLTAPDPTEWNNLVNAPTVSRPANYDEEDNGLYPKTSWEDPNAPTNQPKPKGDGMPTWWENLRGFNPLVNDAQVVMSDGYTRLEHYLQDQTLIANWNADANGDWSDHLNWRGTRPEAIDATANFVAGITAPRTINVDLPVNVGQLSFAGNVGYTLAGAGAISMRVISGTATIDVTGGAHTISAPLSLANNTLVTVTPPDGLLTVTNLQPTGVTLTKAGAGKLAVNALRATGLTINGGAVAVIPDGTSNGVSVLNNLTLAGATNAWSAQLDLANNDLVLHSNSANRLADAARITNQIKQGFNLAANDSTLLWKGNGITTTLGGNGVSNSHTLGIAVNDLLLAGGGSPGPLYSTFDGESVGINDILIKYTLFGDANLDGEITSNDYFQIDAGFLSGRSGWVNGDFDYDGTISSNDYFLIDNAFLSQSAMQPGFAISSVPEPAELCSLAISLCLIFPRCRHRK